MGRLDRRASLSPEQVTPTDINLNIKAQILVITWQDGHRSQFELGYLRRVCPCATCRQNRERPATSLPVLKMPATQTKVEVTSAELMGHYALNLKWSDGHDTGIYDYKYLRSLDET